MIDKLIKDMKGLPECGHPHHPLVRVCQTCLMSHLVSQCRFYLAQELRQHLELEKERPGFAGRHPDYLKGFADAITQLDPNGAEFLDIMADAFEGEFEEIAKILKRKPKR